MEPLWSLDESLLGSGLTCEAEGQAALSGLLRSISHKAAAVEQLSQAKLASAPQ